MRLTIGGAKMRARFGVTYEVKTDGQLTQCEACRKHIKNEPYAIRYQYYYDKLLVVDKRCWRCYHGNEITQLFLDKYPNLFRRAKRGRWFFLELLSDQFHFPSTDGEHDPDW